MIRRFRPLRDSDIRALEARVNAAIEVWSVQWLQDRSVGPATVLPLGRGDLAGVEGAGHWLTLRTDDVAVAAVWVSQDAARALAEMTVDPDPVSAAESAHPLVSGLVDRALADLVQGLPLRAGKASTLSAEGPAAGAFLPGSGDAHIALDIGRGRASIFLVRDLVDWILGTTAAKTVVRTQRALEPRAPAIRRSKLRLEVRLQETGLSVADIKRLQNQDVIMFDHRINRPLHVRVQSGADIGACYLGRRESRRAVKLVKKEESTT